MKPIFGAAEKALELTELRATLISSNLVNSSTPHYKAKDIDFTKAMQDAEAEQQRHLAKTNSQHMESPESAFGVEVQYRVPMQVSMDGNTVDPEIERKNFLENSMRYQVSLTFIKSKSDELMKALRGT